MNPIAGIVCLQERLEGDLRYSHMRVRKHAEQVGLPSDQIVPLIYTQGSH